MVREMWAWVTRTGRLRSKPWAASAMRRASLREMCSGIGATNLRLRLLAVKEQPLGEHQGVHGPEIARARLADGGHPFNRPAAQDHLPPLVRDRVASVNSAEQRA